MADSWEEELRANEDDDDDYVDDLEERDAPEAIDDLDDVDIAELKQAGQTRMFNNQAAKEEAVVARRVTAAFKRTEGATRREPREIAGTGNQVKQMAGDLKTGHMTPVVRFVRAKLPGVPDFMALARVRHNLRGSSLVTARHAMATAATPYTSHLAKAQFPTESVPQLASAASALGTALADRAAAESRRVIATAGVQQELALGREAVAMLDPIVTKKLANQKDLLAGWRSAKRVTQRSQSAAAPAAPGTPVTPAVPPVPPAAPAQAAPTVVPTPRSAAATTTTAARAATAQEVKAA